MRAKLFVKASNRIEEAVNEFLAKEQPAEVRHVCMAPTGSGKLAALVLYEEKKQRPKGNLGGFVARG
jgi:CRISPR/Cas system-associated endonuclease/helicase Cas3